MKSALPKRHQPRLTAIDLFSGCGGLTCGLKDAGFTIVAAIENNVKAQHTYRLNHLEVRLYTEDIRKIDATTLLRDLNLEIGELDLLAGCPPCQGFSRLRTRNRQVYVEDERNNLVAEFLRYVIVMQPKTVMFENVPSLRKDQRFESMCNQLMAQGYEIEVRVLDAGDYGVPQRRKRLILIASRVHKPRVAPRAVSQTTVRHAFRGLEAPSRTKDKLHAFPERRSEAVKTLIALIPKNGGSRSDLGDAHQLPCHRRIKGFHDVYGRMTWDALAPTITSGCHNPSKGRFLHPSLNRTITLREAAVLQGFPRTYKFDVAHGKEAIALMIGNALPPAFIAAHAGVLKQALLERSRRNRLAQ
jgi:DNA (cytosine-5)-methyltransferase 1